MGDSRMRRTMGDSFPIASEDPATSQESKTNGPNYALLAPNNSARPLSNCPESWPARPTLLHCGRRRPETEANRPRQIAGPIEWVPLSHRRRPRRAFSNWSVNNRRLSVPLTILFFFFFFSCFDPRVSHGASVPEVKERFKEPSRFRAPSHDEFDKLGPPPNTSRPYLAIN